ncbi:HugZ family protein [Glaciecola sp. SC05]|uniref:HugZ family pyridoxamine 5'-phosphate oxidase n=1 Tax=Glaciecola sp. SC05 TaxID=1987355 RepID=UPI003527EB45
MSNKSQHIQQARTLMRSQHSGALATISLSIKGFPFGSVSPYLMTESGDLIIYASDIAQHSRNMKADPHVSLLVHDGAQNDSQASARVTVLALAKADAVSKAQQEAYFMLFPQAKKYVQAHDFRFYLLSTQRVRYIGGFGEIYWFSQDEWQADVISLDKQAQPVIDHMHEDHADALAEIFNFTTKSKANEGEVKMLSCFAEGFHVTHQQNIHFIGFIKPLGRRYDLRNAMIELTKAARCELEVT